MGKSKHPNPMERGAEGELKWGPGEFPGGIVA